MLKKDISLMSLRELREEASAASPEELEELARMMGQDPREGVRKLASSLEKRTASLLRERERIGQMRRMETELIESGISPVAGVDEAGRGPLCGPVVSCTLILPEDFSELWINDSKKLTEKKREELFRIITQNAVACEVGVAGPDVIDEINILRATIRTVEESLSRIKVKPAFVLLDALKVDTDIPQRSIIKGDAKVYSIAAASIVAKVTRDHMMYEYDSLYPEYHLSSNKGYGTAEHIEALKKYGPSPIHRKTFIGNII